MKAAQISEYGDVSVVNVVEAAKPQAGPGQILVEVRASSVNPFDSSVRAGFLKDSLTLPMTLGGDVAGVVAEVGDEVSWLHKGDKVWGQSYAVSGDSGSWAEFAPWRPARWV